MFNFKRFFNVLFLLSLLFLAQNSYAGVNFSPGLTDTCDLTGFLTYTQGGWGSSSNSTPGQIRDQYFDLVFPSDLVAGGNYTLTLTTAATLMNFLPQGGTANPFNQNYIDPTSTSAGILGGQLVAAMMNYHFDLAGYIGSNNEYTLGQLVITSGPFMGKTVQELLEIANIAIGGGVSAFSYSEINTALTNLNENFDNGTVNHGFLTCPPSPASLGDRVWFDTNRNGIQDEGENGVPGIVVKLYTCADVMVAETTTAPNGYYIFDNLAPGDYYVKFFLPANHVITLADQGADDLFDSDADPVTGKTICTTLSQNEHDVSWDAGIYSTFAAIGDRVWYDANNNGIQDQGENGVAGVVVRLFGTGAVMINSTITDQNGLYLFSNLIPGDYYIQFVLPENYAFSPADQGSNDEIDSDAGTDGFTTPTTLISDETDLTWDAGIYLTVEESDLSLTKLVDDPEPENGDIIKFSIQVTNNGPATATNVKVIDILPVNVIYLSNIASQGTYDTSSGLWMVGTLAGGSSATLDISVQVNIDTAGNNIIDLGPAKGFNVFVLNDVNQPSSDTQGKMAVGRDAYLANYSVGDMLPNSNGTIDVLVVGRNLTFISGAVYGGNIVYGGTSNLPVPSVSVIHGTIRQDSVINFDAARAYLQNLSSQLGGYTANGTTEFLWGTITCTGTDPHLNIFNVSGADLSAANNFEINVPANSVALINISGNNITWMGGLTVTGTDFTNVLYNFTDAGQLNLHGIDVQGSILAPLTDVNFQAGVQHGQMIAKSLTGSGQFNLSFFMGHIPGQGKIINVAEVYFADQYDPDSTPNNGVDTEDDYGKVVVNVGGQTGGSGNWQYVGTFAEGEMILTLLDDLQGNLYAGTLGGKILKSTDNGLNWTRINLSMNAVYIWSLVKNSSGELFAGTELGVYKSLNETDWLITSLSDKDVRTLKLDNTGNIFAGAWGYGIYKSTDAGLTWILKNNGMVSVAVHSLSFNLTGDLLAATLDLGIYKSTDGGESWNNSLINFDYIWSLGRTSDGTLFAGTYGNGLYRSTDNGDTWHKLYNLVPTYIYQIVVDAEDNIFVSSWTGGVFVSTDNGNNWGGLGMPGARVSSMINDPSSSAIYAATEDGKLYKSNSITSAEGEFGLPTEFDLMQNYPNPFNPVTVIRFNIPETGNYSLKVFNLLGQEVRTLVNDNYKPGKYVVTLDASKLSSGVYFYTLSGNKVNITKKMVLIK
jgi:choice-of-anchor A domain-containing protein/uncharacterized repeat protein (TIGR01451 family)